MPPHLCFILYRISDYNPSNSSYSGEADDSTLTPEQEPASTAAEEVKYIVYESCLKQLLKLVNECLYLHIHIVELFPRLFCTTVIPLTVRTAITTYTYMQYSTAVTVCMSVSIDNLSS